MMDWTRIYDFFFFFSFSTFEKIIAILGVLTAWGALYSILKEWRQKRLLSKEFGSTFFYDAE